MNLTDIMLFGEATIGVGSGVKKADFNFRRIAEYERFTAPDGTIVYKISDETPTKAEILGGYFGAMTSLDGSGVFFPLAGTFEETIFEETLSEDDWVMEVGDGMMIIYSHKRAEDEGLPFGGGIYAPSVDDVFSSMLMWGDGEWLNKE